MKTNNISKWAALLTVSGLLTITTPLTVTAQNLVVTTDTTVSGTHYENKATGTAALTNSGTWTFTGSDIVLTGTAASGVGRYGANFTGGGKLNLSDSRVDANLYGIQLTNTSAATLTDTVINSGSVANGYGVYMTTSSTLAMTGGTVTTGTGNTSYGLNLSGASVATLNNVSIVTSSSNGHGVNLATSSTLTMIGGTITTGTTGGNGINAVTASVVDVRDTVINAYNFGLYLTSFATADFSGTIVTNGITAHGLYSTSSNAINLGDNVSITTNDSGRGIYINSVSATLTVGDRLTVNSGGIGITVVTGAAITAPVNSADITTRNDSAHGISYASGVAPLTLNGGTIHTLGNNASGLNLTGTSTAALNNVSIITEGDSAFGVYAANSSTLTVSGGTIQTGGVSARGLNLSGTSVGVLNGVNIILTGSSSYGIYTAGNSKLTGEHLVIQATNGGYGVIASGGAQVTLTDVEITISNGRNTGGLAVNSEGTVLSAINVRIRADGTDVAGLRMASHNGATLELTNLDLAVSGPGAMIAYLASNAPIGSTDVHTLIINSGTLTSAERGFAVNPQDTYYDLSGYPPDGISGNYDITLRDVLVSASSMLEVNTIRSGTYNNGTLGTVEFHADLTMTAERSTLQGDANFQGIATGTVMLTDNSALTGNLNASGSSALTVTLNNSVLTGASAVADTAMLNLSLRNNANWNLTGKSKLTTLHGANGGTITIDNVQGEDLIVSGNNGVSGITGETKLHLTLSDSVKGDQEIWVVVDETNKMSGERFKLVNEVSYGMYQYELVNATDGAWLVYTGSSGTTPPVNPPPIDPPGPDTPPTISSEGDAVINTAAAVAGFWFTQLDNLHKRMGELRYNKPAGGDLINNVWVRAYGQQINANTGIYSVKGFSETQYGVDLGTDYLWKLDADNQLYTGVFAGYGGADRDFHTNYSGNTDSGYGGLYATWLNNSSWYADVVAKGQYFRNEFSGADRGDYDSVGMGFSVEFGRQFEFKDGWFAEPSVQFSYLHLMNDNYTTRDGMHIDLTDADVLHIYGGARFGRNIKLNNSGRLQPYIKAGGLGQISGGNTLTVSGDHWRPNLDGARAVVGAGIIWQLDADSQLHLDYEASFGEKYDKPWGVNFGYRYQF